MLERMGRLTVTKEEKAFVIIAYRVETSLSIVSKIKIMIQIQSPVHR